MKKNILKDKGGDITVAILTLGIIAVCFLALISFYLASLDTDKNFNGIREIIKASADMEKYLSGKKVEIRPSDGWGEHLYNSIKRSTGFFGLGGSKIFFEVKYYLP